MRILYIEDNPANISLLQRIARMGGHDVLHYNDGEVALSNFERDKPDLILVDLQLAGVLDGLDVVRKLRADGVKLPIVAVTAYAMVGDKERCLQAGCDGYLAKPLPVAELVEIVQKYQLVAKTSGVKPVETPKETMAAPVTPVAETPKPVRMEDSTLADRSRLVRETAALIDPARSVAAERKVEEEKAEPPAPVKAAETPPADSAAPAKVEAVPKPPETPAPKAEPAPAASVSPAASPTPKADTSPVESAPATPAPKVEPALAASVSPAASPTPKADTAPVESAPSISTPKLDPSQDKPVSPNGDTIKFAVLPQKAENGKKD
jgi:two-component system cell cycle response regulator DivK